MAMSVRFCLLYDPLKWDFIPFKMKNISTGKRIVGMDIINDVMLRAKVLLHVWSYHFYDTTLSTDSNMTLMFSPIERIGNGAVWKFVKNHFANVKVFNFRALMTSHVNMCICRRPL